MTARYADRDEVFEAGDAFYSPPDHVPVTNEPGTEFVWFSLSGGLHTTSSGSMTYTRSHPASSAGARFGFSK